MTSFAPDVFARSQGFRTYQSQWALAESCRWDGMPQGYYLSLKSCTREFQLRDILLCVSGFILSIVAALSKIKGIPQDGRKWMGEMDEPMDPKKWPGGMAIRAPNCITIRWQSHLAQARTWRLWLHFIGMLWDHHGETSGFHGIIMGIIILRFQLIGFLGKSTVETMALTLRGFCDFRFNQF